MSRSLAMPCVAQLPLRPFALLISRMAVLYAIFENSYCVSPLLECLLTLSSHRHKLDGLLSTCSPPPSGLRLPVYNTSLELPAQTMSYVLQISGAEAEK
ncbi:hypothetical protein EDB87DRAFT_1641653 [Lactarius vividus]|nr:hypothetical protein EDB87DRAFT_1641653 [Lactarius vividus]